VSLFINQPETLNEKNDLKGTLNSLTWAGNFDIVENFQAPSASHSILQFAKFQPCPLEDENLNGNGKRANLLYVICILIERTLDAGRRLCPCKPGFGFVGLYIDFASNRPR
jgi:hypothetical protein